MYSSIGINQGYKCKENKWWFQNRFLNFEDIDILEMYNSDNDIDSLLFKITEGQNLGYDQNQQKLVQSNSWDQPHGISKPWICLSFECLTMSNLIIHNKEIYKKWRLKYWKKSLFPQIFKIVTNKKNGKNSTPNKQNNKKKHSMGIEDFSR